MINRYEWISFVMILIGMALSVITLFFARDSSAVLAWLGGLLLGAGLGLWAMDV